MRRSTISVAVTLLFLAGCTQKPKIECTSSDATTTTIELIKNQLQDSVYKNLTTGGRATQVTKSNIRATIQQLIISLDDIRTSKEDPNSTRKFCTANLDIKTPSQLIIDADKARSDAGLGTVAVLADQNNVDQQADTYKITFDYNVQPTDSGDKVYAQSDDFAKITGFFGELISSSLLKTAVEQAQVQQQQAAQAQLLQQQAAQTEQRNADLASAKTDNQLANQTIAAVWKNLSPDTRARLLDDQRAWIRKKIADCNVVAASASVDPTEQDTARTKCDTQATQQRTLALQQLSGTIQ